MATRTAVLTSAASRRTSPGTCPEHDIGAGVFQRWTLCENPALQEREALARVELKALTGATVAEPGGADRALRGGPASGCRIPALPVRSGGSVRRHGRGPRAS